MESPPAYQPGLLSPGQCLNLVLPPHGLGPGREFLGVNQPEGQPRPDTPGAPAPGMLFHPLLQVPGDTRVEGTVPASQDVDKEGHYYLIPLGLKNKQARESPAQKSGGMAHY